MRRKPLLLLLALVVVVVIVVVYLLGTPEAPIVEKSPPPPAGRPPGGHGDGRRQVPHSIRDEPTRCRGPHRRRDGSRWERRGLVPRAGFVPMAARQIVRSVACSAYKAITFSSYRRPGD